MRGYVKKVVICYTSKYKLRNLYKLKKCRGLDDE